MTTTGVLAVDDHGYRVNGHTPPGCSPNSTARKTAERDRIAQEAINLVGLNG